MDTPIEMWLRIIRHENPGAHRPLLDDLDLLPLMAADDGTGEPTRGVSLGDLIAAGRRWLITAEAGAGKSALLSLIARSLASPSRRLVPICVSMRRLAESRLHPTDWAEGHLARIVGARRALGLADSLDALAADGSVCLLLDEAEGVPEAERETLLLMLSTWSGARSDERRAPAIVVAGRPECRRWMPPTFTRLRVDVEAMAARSRRLLAAALSGAAPAGDGPGVEDDGPRFLAELDLPTLLEALHMDLPGDAPTRPALQRRAMGAFVGRRLPAGAADAAYRALGRAVLAPDFVEPASRARWIEAFARPPGPAETPCHAARSEAGHSVWESVTRRSGLLHTLDDPRSPEARWAFAHRSHREALLAEALAARGPGAIAEWAEQVEGSATGSPAAEVDAQRVLGFACAWSEHPWASIRKLAERHQRFAIGALRDVAPLAPREAVRVLLSPEMVVGGPRGRPVWDGNDLEELLALGADAVGAARGFARAFEDALWVTASSDLPLDAAARVYAVLARREPARARAAFFGAASGLPAGPVDAGAFCLIGPGDFTMGSQIEEIRRFWQQERRSGLRLDDLIERELPATWEVIERPFRLAPAPVTLGDFRRFDPDHDQDADDATPVVGVDWWRAHLYAAWAGARLPTEKEWEYACRAGTRTAWWCGNDPEKLREVAVFGLHEDAGPRPIRGDLPKNAWGLSDMHGNVWEWCQDAWRVQRDVAPDDRLRVARGGSFGEEQAAWLRSACRSKGSPSLRWNQLGFRLAQDVGAGREGAEAI